MERNLRRAVTDVPTDPAILVDALALDSIRRG
jgi:hypothetical protein